jgi:RNA polymerase sigma-70 factor (ECF subfamily)
MSDRRAAVFEAHRKRLFALAYRMLGAVGEAEDAVQDTYLRWHRADADAVRVPEAWLVTACTRLCIDRLRAAKTARGAYVGPWLPEPVVAAPDDAGALADSLQMAFLLVLERLSPSERAAYLLHEAFDRGYDEIAGIVGKSPAACRQLVSRAARKVREGRPRYAADAAAARDLARRFAEAAASGDAGAFAALLAADAVVVSDGGGKAVAARNVIAGADRAARFLAGVSRKQPPGLRVRPAAVNGAPGLIGYVAGRPVFALSLAIGEGLIRGVYIVRNPDKLGHLHASEADSPN